MQQGRTPVGLAEDKEYQAVSWPSTRRRSSPRRRRTGPASRRRTIARSYVAITILLAVALFFAGVTASFRYRPARASLLIAALGTVAVAAVQLAGLPIL